MEYANAAATAAQKNNHTSFGGSGGKYLDFSSVSWLAGWPDCETSLFATLYIRPPPVPATYDMLWPFIPAAQYVQCITPTYAGARAMITHSLCPLAGCDHFLPLANHLSWLRRVFIIHIPVRPTSKIGLGLLPPFTSITTPHASSRPHRDVEIHMTDKATQ
ncbi:uncharacterized protein BCR38DRAFT_223638 [Pseudomassariella vexata]|uniref:Uncharacterized protein n=1 Tax=Pseudomassariella vexata TaxID=1141098 RepID=A0A1Y2DVC1_9PEZI|nr:uncharacterized protein BCR38DRAFT_223638 [Pseudomassariella vexata]ORY63197.1 hypothetical protein BCR38DRAFT_223638 [Pseudomassariella vexata]